MINVAVFISGRSLGYRECLFQFLQKIDRTKYNVRLFLSINSLSFGPQENIKSILEDIVNLFQDIIGKLHIEPFRLPKAFVDNRLKHGTDVFHYNQLSCFYNDAKNMENIENYEIDNNIKFDVICKTRSELFFFNQSIEFTVDEPSSVIIHNKHPLDIRHWGHIYKDTPLMISDAFAYGNKESMKIFCSTYNWILENDFRMNGKYLQTFEIYLTDSILNHIFYTIPGGGHEPKMSKDEIMSIYTRRIKIIQEDCFIYDLIPIHIRGRNNFVVNKDNVYQYTHLNLCVVFVCNKAFFNKFIYTCNQLITNGRYNGNICLVIGDDLHNDELLNSDFIKKNNITIKYFPNISFTNDFLDIQKKMNREPHWFQKRFQFHKFRLFDIFFKKWDYIFYLDCGIHIFSDISPMLNLITENTLLAHSDAYPLYERKLHDQFDKENIEYFTKLNNTFKLNDDYFQTTIMLYDTKIIENNTCDDLLSLLIEYPISITNDQGIIALYFTNIKPLFKQIKTHNENLYFYDYLSRNKNNKYIMLKSLYGAH